MKKIIFMAFLNLIFYYTKAQLTGYPEGTHTNLSIATFHVGQTGSFSSNDFANCGTWEEKPVYYTDWISIDTLSKHSIKGTVRNWVYNPNETDLTDYTDYAVYSPCGFGRTHIYEQYRVCSITGIRQKRQKIIESYYVPKRAPPKTEYEKTIDGFK